VIAMPSGFLAKSLYALAGLLIWALHFGAIYVFQALACARGFAGREVAGADVVTVFIVAATVIALLASAAAIAAGWRTAGANVELAEHDEFLRRLGLLVAGLSVVAIIWEALPVLMMPPCS
jgi:hypothetical protein